MWPFIKKFFTDETVFERAVRAGAIGIGTAIASGYIPVPPKWQWVGLALAALGGFIGAGEKNKSIEGGK